MQASKIKQRPSKTTSRLCNKANATKQCISVDSHHDLRCEQFPMGGRERKQLQLSSIHQCMWFTIAKLLVPRTAWLAVNWESGLAGSSCGEGGCSKARASLLQLWSRKTDEEKLPWQPQVLGIKEKESGRNTNACEGREDESCVTNKQGHGRTWILSAGHWEVQ